MQHNTEVMKFCVVSYLSDVRKRRAIMRDLEYRIDSLRERLEGLGMPQRDNVSGGERQDIADKLAQIQRLEQRWTEAVADNAQAIAIAASLCPASEPECYCLWLHYVEHLTWAQTARQIGYSDTHVKRTLAPKGIETLYNAMPEEYRRYSIPNAMPR